MQVVERDFTKDGKMKPLPRQQAKLLKGYLPFFSVDTQEEADAVIREALKCGEFVKYGDAIVEMTLAYQQTIPNLNLAGERLRDIHRRTCHADAVTT